MTRAEKLAAAIFGTLGGVVAAWFWFLHAPKPH